MRIERIRYAFDSVEAEIDALGQSGSLQLLQPRRKFFGIAELRRQVLLERHADVGHGRVQLERKPRNDAGAVHGGQRVVQAFLAEVAPRANQVGDDIDLQRCRRWPHLAGRDFCYAWSNHVRLYLWAVRP